MLNKKIDSLEAENKLVTEKSAKQEKHVIYQAEKLKEMEATLKEIRLDANAESSKEIKEKQEEIARLTKLNQELEIRIEEMALNEQNKSNQSA